jgi:hypothetical protein
MCEAINVRLSARRTAAVDLTRRVRFAAGEYALGENDRRGNWRRSRRDDQWRVVEAVFGPWQPFRGMPSRATRGDRRWLGENDQRRVENAVPRSRQPGSSTFSRAVRGDRRGHGRPRRRNDQGRVENAVASSGHRGAGVPRVQHLRSRAVARSRLGDRISTPERPDRDDRCSPERPVSQAATCHVATILPSRAVRHTFTRWAVGHAETGFGTQSRPTVIVPPCPSSIARRSALSSTPRP